MSEQADRDTLAEVLAAHRINYHHRNIGGEKSSELRYTSCDGCDWKGGWHDEAGWEGHLADMLAQRDRRVRAECLREAAMAVGDYWCDPGVSDEVIDWLRERADRIEARP